MHLEKYDKLVKLLRDIENHTLDKEQKDLLRLARSIIEEHIYDQLEKRL
jgi:hypothetical protein